MARKILPFKEKFSCYVVSLGRVTDYYDKPSLMVSIGNTEDPYDGLLMHLSPKEALILSEAIERAARAMQKGE